MDDLYILTEGDLMAKIGAKIKASRLKQNITQRSLSDRSGVPLSTLKRLESGGEGSIETLLRALRALGLFHLIEPMVEEERLSPVEYYELIHNAHNRRRQRAVGAFAAETMEDSEW